MWLVGGEFMYGEDWYALQVYTGKEKWVASMLDERGHEVMLLQYTVVHLWSDRRKRIDRPVFPGYVFCHFDAHLRSPILAVPGVLRIVGFGGRRYLSSTMRSRRWRESPTRDLVSRLFPI